MIHWDKRLSFQHGALQLEPKSHTLIEEIARSPWGVAVNRKEESAIAAKRVIIHDDRKAETLLILEKMLCILGIPQTVIE